MFDLPLLQVSLVDRMSPHDIFPLVVVALSLLVGVVISVTAIVVTNWRGYRERRMATVLIQEMLDRNMSSAEIQQVMSVWGKTGDQAAESLSRRRQRHEIPVRPPKPVL